VNEPVNQSKNQLSSMLRFQKVFVR